MGKLLLKVLDIGSRDMFGAVPGGERLRQFGIVAAGILGRDGEDSQLIARTYVDPELTAHLLTREVSAAERPAWDAELNWLLGYDAAARDGMQGAVEAAASVQTEPARRIHRRRCTQKAAEPSLF